VILSVNAGNTNIRAAVGTNGKVIKDAKFATKDLLTEADFVNFAQTNFGDNIWKELDGGIISSVVPAKTELISNPFTAKTGKGAKRVNSKNCLPVLNTSGYGGNLGEDRAACCAGAVKKYGAPFALIDFGTAVSVNIVDKGGIFKGGAILLGVNKFLKAISENTAQLPRLEIRDKINIIGKNTEENILSGAVRALAFAAEGYIETAKQELGENMRVIITGGQAQDVLPYCGFKNIFDPAILFKGLFALYEGMKN
jgi:type III pantothenate kinase